MQRHFLHKDMIRRQNKFLRGKKNYAIGEHPAHAFAESNKKYKVNVITHSKRFFERKTNKLFDNPNKNNNQKDKRPSRLSIPKWLDKKNFVKKPLKNWRMSKRNRALQRKINKRYK